MKLIQRGFYAPLSDTQNYAYSYFQVTPIFIISLYQNDTIKKNIKGGYNG
jgi:hypothetical protein